MGAERDIVEIGVSYGAGWYGATLIQGAASSRWCDDPAITATMHQGVDPLRLCTDPGYLADMAAAAYLCCCDPRVAMGASAAAVALGTLAVIEGCAGIPGLIRRARQRSSPR
jgi:hypothetical protein